MDKATISELKNRLSAYLDRVRAGHSVLIFDRDRPIARLERVEVNARPDDRLARLERAGLIRRAKAKVDLKALRLPPPRARQSVRDALIEERREGR